MCGTLAFTICAEAQEAGLPVKKQVLFICTGNYYRSRFAEALFNQKAREAHLDWHAASRGLDLAPSQHGISIYSRKELLLRHVPKEFLVGEPKRLTKEDLKKSDCIVLMNEAEHRPMLEKRFPVRDDSKIRYWHVPEAGKLKPAKACEAMAREIDELIATLER